MTIERKLIEKQKELNDNYAFRYVSWSKNEADKITQLKSEIASLESELAKEPIINPNQPIGSTTDFIIKQGPEISIDELSGKIANKFMDELTRQKQESESTKYAIKGIPNGGIEVISQEPKGLKAEEILDNYSHYGKLHDGTNCFVVEYTDAVKAMETYAESKQINLREITDSDIETWAEKIYPSILAPVFKRLLIKGAKAVINGEIKHIEK